MKRRLAVAAVFLLSACASLGQPPETAVYDCARRIPLDAEGRPRPNIPNTEWEARVAACRDCLACGGTVAGCAGGGR